MSNQSSCEIGVWIHGFSGRMGQELCEALRSQSASLTLMGGSDFSIFDATGKVVSKFTEFNIINSLKKASIIFDFSSVSGNQALLDLAEQGILSQKFLVIGTTGLSQSAVSSWENLAHKQSAPSILIAPNTSLGIMLMIQACIQIAKTLLPLNFDIELLEYHHRGKADAPSGTAKLLASVIAEHVPVSAIFGRNGVRQSHELGISSIRGGNIFGEHSMMFLGEMEEITVTHRALSRRVFADGALTLGKWLLQQPKGFYSIQDVKF